MKELLQAWLATLEARRGPKLVEEIFVRGDRDKHLGPRWEKASASVRAKPSDQFLCSVANAQAMRPEEKGYADWFVFGLLDVLLPSETISINCIELVVSDLVVDPVESSRRAFRLAGQDAARKIVESVKASPFAQQNTH